MKNSLICNNFPQDIIVDYINTRSHRDDVLNHYHDYYEIYFYLGNHMRYFINDQPYDVSENDIVLIDRFTIHRSLYKHDDRHHRLLILFNPSLLKKPGRETLKRAVEDLFQHQKVSIIDAGKLETFRQKAVALHRTFIDRSRGFYEDRLEYEFLTVLLDLVTLKEEERVFNHEMETLTPAEQLVRNTIEYINKHYKEKILLDTIAEGLFVSKYYLSRTFNSVMNTSISAYLNARRLSEAERLIRYSEMSLTQICREVGFLSNSYFIKLFKQEYGNTPQAFREALEE